MKVDYADREMAKRQAPKRNGTARPPRTPSRFHTCHQRAIAEKVHELVLANNRHAATLAQGAVRMATGFYDPVIQAAIVQKHVAGYDLYDAYAFGQVLASITNGDIAFSIIELGAQPGRDADIAGNNMKLADLPAPFRAKFWGGVGDADGVLEWTAPITLVRLTLDDTESVVCHPGTAPLEVGYVLASQSWFQLTQSRFLARWPYGSDSLLLFRVCNRRLWSDRATSFL
jgi:hypothetical protein